MRGAEALRIRFRATPHETLNSATISRQIRAGARRGRPGHRGTQRRRRYGRLRGSRTIVRGGLRGAVPDSCTDGPVGLAPWRWTRGAYCTFGAFAGAGSVSPSSGRSCGLADRPCPDPHHQLGGGFGRRIDADGVPGAVRTAMAVRKPVKFFWRRETRPRRRVSPGSGRAAARCDRRAGQGHGTRNPHVGGRRSTPICLTGSSIFGMRSTDYSTTATA